MKDLIHVFFHMTLNIKLFHWNTRSFAKHKATDQLLTALQPLIDQFVEVYIGKYNRLEMEEESFSVEVHNFEDSDFQKLMEYYISVLKKDVPKQLKSSDTDLLNIRDEMLALFNQTLYLFTLS